MTSFTAKQTLMRPLADRTNIINMKSSKLGKNIERSKEIKAPTTPVKKSRRIRKRNILLEDVYQVCAPKTHFTDTVNKKIPINRDFAPNKTELIKSIRILNTENIKNVKSPRAVSQIDKTRAKTSTSDSQKTLHVRDKNNKATKKNHQLNNDLVDFEPVNIKEAICTKELVVKISRIPESEHVVNPEEISFKHRSQRTRTKSVLLDETVYQIYDQTIKSFTSNFKKGTEENVPNKADGITCTDKKGQTKSKDVDKSVGDSSIRMKELIVEVTPIVNNTLEENKLLKKKNKDKNIDKKLNNHLIGTKELVVKITPLLELGNIITKKIPTIQYRMNRRKSLFHETDSGMESITKHLDNNGEQININKEMNSGNAETEIIGEKENIRGTDPINLQSPKQLFVNLTQLSNDAKEADGKTKDPKKTGPKSHGSQKSKVKFNLNMTKPAESHNLRNLQAKNYAEESMIDTSIGNLEKPKNDLCSEIVLQTKHHIPIYRKNVPDVPESNKNPNDLYEFIDTSPKPKKMIKRGARNSSILFDKNTHEILQKIEEKEAKAVKKRGKKKKGVSKPTSKLHYDRKVGRILSNIKKKISKKNGGNTDLIITEKRSATSTLTNNVQSKKNVPLNHTRIIQVNNFNDEMGIIVHHAKEPTNKDKSQVKSRENITFRRGKTPVNNNVQNNRNLATDVVREKPNLNTFGKQKETANARQDLISPSLFDSINVCSDFEDDRDEYLQVQNATLRRERITKNSVNDNSNLINTFDKLKGSVGVVQSKAVPEPSDSVSISDSDTQDDIDSCFGFDEGPVPPVASTSSKVTSKKAINVLKNVVVTHGIENVESPVDFNVRRPNANSTMVNIGTQTRNSSPWRTEWFNARPNPHFISVKSNALPRIHQEPVLEHTLVEGFEKCCSKTPKKATPAKKAPVQQSILSFVESNVEIENEPLQSSLYDYEEFTSPVKKIGKGKENQRVEGVKRNLMGIKDNIVSSTPIQRKALGDISNSSGELIISNSITEENSYFGFNESSLTKKTPEKRRNGKTLENTEADNVAKPLRFDLSALRSYSVKGRKKKTDDKGKKKVSFDEEIEIQVPDRSISLMVVSNEGADEEEEEVHLFEEPEELLDNTSPVPIPGKKHRRKRLDSCDSDAGEQEKKRKRHKKTKLEIEQEEWIEQFNHMCDEIDQHKLELE